MPRRDLRTISPMRIDPIFLLITVLAIAIIWSASKAKRARQAVGDNYGRRATDKLHYRKA